MRIQASGRHRNSPDPGWGLNKQAGFGSRGMKPRTGERVGAGGAAQAPEPRAGAKMLRLRGPGHLRVCSETVSQEPRTVSELGVFVHESRFFCFTLYRTCERYSKNPQASCGAAPGVESCAPTKLSDGDLAEIPKQFDEAAK